MPTDASSASIDMEMCERHARRAVLRMANRVLGSGVQVMAILPSVNNFVYELRSADTRYVGKYSFLGLAKSSLRRRLGEVGFAAAVDEQAAYCQSRTAMDLEAGHLKLLQHLRPGLAPTLIGAGEGVLLEEWVDGTPAVMEALLSGDTAASLMAAVLDEVEQLWSIDQEAVRAIIPGGLPSGSRIDVCQVFARKFTGPGSADYLSSLELAQAPADSLEYVVRELGSRLAAFEQLASRSRVIFGDLKPDHAVFIGGRLRLFDPALNLSDPAIEVARLLSRSALVVVANCDHRRVEALCRIVDRVVDRAAKAFAAESWAWIEALVVADLINLLTAYLVLDQRTGQSLTPAYRAAYSSATALLNALILSYKAGPLASESRPLAELLTRWHAIYVDGQFQLSVHA